MDAGHKYRQNFIVDISFVIPAYNEADNIENVITSIKTFVPDGYSYEILVVDHGSQDNTIALAKAAGANALLHAEGTIAGLRNYGVARSSGKVLIFLDADILLTVDWQTHIVTVIPALIAGERILTGSWYSIPDQPNWIEKYWFKPLERGDNSHINSGHLIISRQVFDEINGFDEALETGEDYDISIRAKAAGIRLIDDIRLRVIHEGYPKSLLEFARREFWHGKGDATSFPAFFQSKVAVVALLFVTLHVFALISACYKNETAFILLLLAITGITAGMSFFKYRGTSLLNIIVNSFLYYVYFWARGLSVLSLPAIRTLRKRTR